MGEAAGVELMLREGGLSIISWNTRATFGSVLSHIGRQQLRFARIISFAQHNDVIILQELHGGAADLEVLVNCIKTHIWKGAFSADGKSGGTAVGIARSKFGILADSDVDSLVLVAGRTLAVSWQWEEQTFCIIGTHFEAWLDSEIVQGMFSSMARVLFGPSAANVIGFLVGDFNFVCSGEDRHSFGNAADTGADAATGAFESILSGLCEVHQPEHTRVEKNAGYFVSTSRLDRGYTTLRTANILDLAPEAHTVGNLLGIHNASDHIPVRFIFGGRPKTFAVKVQPWTFAHPAFPGEFQKLLEGCALNGHPRENVEFVKDCMRGAADRVLKVCVLRGANSTNEKCFWALRALRCGRDLARGAAFSNVEWNLSRLRDCMLAMPSLRIFFDEDLLLVNAEALHDEIESLNRVSIDEQLAEVESLKHLPAYMVNKIHDKLHRWQRTWSPKNRRAKGFQVAGCDGVVCNNATEAGEALKSWWAPKFAEGKINKLYAKQLAQHTQQQSCGCYLYFE